jgi:hypothetical protein
MPYAPCYHRHLQANRNTPRPTRAQDGQNATEVRKIGAQFDESYKVELAKSFRDVVNSGFRAANLPEFSDIPDGAVDGFVELGWGDLGCGNSRFKREQTLSNLEVKRPRDA